MAKKAFNVEGISKLVDMFDLFADFVDFLFLKWKMLLGYIVSYTQEFFASFRTIMEKAVTGDSAGLGKKLLGIHDYAAEVARLIEEDHFDSLTKKGEEYAKNVVNIKEQKISINQDFKGEANPDRIAYQISKHLKRISENPTGSRGKSFGFNGKTSMVNAL